MDETTGREGVFHSSREIPHAPERVWAAFARRELLERWWGPAGFTNTFETFEFTPGGRWIFTMHGPEAGHYHNESTFVELERPARIVIRHDCAPFYVLTITLEPAAGGTRIEWLQAFDDPAVGERIRHIVGPANEQNLDRLEAVLSDQPVD